MSFRFFNPATREWAIHWADNRRGVLDPPVLGAFVAGHGHLRGPGHVRRPADPRPLRVVPDPDAVAALGAGVLRGRRQDVGNQLGDGFLARGRRGSERRPAGHRAPHGLSGLRAPTLRDPAGKAGAASPGTSRASFPKPSSSSGRSPSASFSSAGIPPASPGFAASRPWTPAPPPTARSISVPLWKEHRSATNAMILDSDNVLLLRPLHPERGVAVLPAVDPAGAGARGVVAAQIFPIRAGDVDAFARQAEPTFAAYRAAGAREAGVLVTLTFPTTSRSTRSGRTGPSWSGWAFSRRKARRRTGSDPWRSGPRKRSSRPACSGRAPSS